MNHGISLAAIILTTAVFLGGCTKKHEIPSMDAKTQAGHEDPDGFYTCSMHPQVHEHKAGQCPICGMALTKVSAKTNAVREQETPAGVPATEAQLSLAGIGKHTVDRKDLDFSIPVSGRTVSSREVTFQVYEADLQLIRVGLDFMGSTPAAPEEILRGKIRQVDTLLDPSSRTVRVLGLLDAPSKRVVMDGGFYGEITAKVKNQIAIPESAVLHAGTRDLVYVIAEGNQLKPTPVILGRKTMREYQILSGLLEGEVISSGPNFLIDSEAKIRGGNDKTHH